METRCEYSRSIRFVVVNIRGLRCLGSVRLDCSVDEEASILSILN